MKKKKNTIIHETHHQNKFKSLTWKLRPENKSVRINPKINLQRSQFQRVSG